MRLGNSSAQEAILIRKAVWGPLYRRVSLFGEQHNCRSPARGPLNSGRRGYMASAKGLYKDSMRVDKLIGNERGEVVGDSYGSVVEIS